MKVPYEIIWENIETMIEEKEIYYEKDTKIALMYFYDLECKIVNKLMSLQNSECQSADFAQPAIPADSAKNSAQRYAIT